MKAEKNNAHVVAYRKSLMADASERLKSAHSKGYSNSGNEYLLEVRAIKWAKEKAA